MAIPILGDLVKGVLGIGNTVVDKLVPDKDLAAKLKHDLAMALRQDNQEFRVLTEQLEAQMFLSQQETIQAELHQSDLYTKRTRPKIARQSWYVTAAYALSGTFIPVLPAAWSLQAPQIQWEMFLVLASPALTYMGVRGFEKWKNGGSK